MPTPLTDPEIAAAVAYLPPVSVVLQRILKVLGDPHAPIEDIGRLVRAETGLATQVLRTANSAFFGLPSPVMSIDEAIQRLGIAEINRLVTVLGSRQLFLHPLRVYGLPAEVLWGHTLTVAVCAETLAVYAEVDRNSAHLAGILHPIGMIALERISAARKIKPRPALSALQDWEMTMFGTDNAAVAARVLRHWQFPESLAAAVGGRYDPDHAGDARHSASLLHLASLMAEKLGGELPGERGRFPLSPARFAAAGMAWDVFAEAEAEAGQNLERTRALLQVG
jgi:HD-like signal output (HDOD) protein